MCFATSLAGGKVVLMGKTGSFAGKGTKFYTLHIVRWALEPDLGLVLWVFGYPPKIRASGA
jgi:hypothetical protein